MTTSTKEGATDGLSPREKEVLRGVLREETYAEIATALNVGFETVKMHMRRIRTKLGISTKSGLAVWASRNLEV